MTFNEVMGKLEGMGSEQVRKINAKNGAEGNQFGVKSGDLRTLAKEIKLNPELAAELWKTGNLDAMKLATLLMRPKQLTADEMEHLVESTPFTYVADWLNTNVLKLHPDKEMLRVKWMQSDQPMLARAAWSLTTERIIKDSAGLDLPALLDRIEAELVDAPEATQWTMNFALAEIGIEHAEHRARAIHIGERLGVYRDFPVSKGCTSPFAPIWISAMAGRQS
jgi:3-methyladenine DNA glycosylase AlkD